MIRFLLLTGAQLLLMGVSAAPVSGSIRRGEFLMSQTNPDPPLAAAEEPGALSGPKPGPAPLPPGKPLPNFHPKPKSLGDVTDRLVADRHRDWRGPGWWKRYGPWIAVGQLGVLIAVGGYLLVTAGVTYQFLLVVAGLAAWAFVRWLIVFSDPG